MSIYSKRSNIPVINIVILGVAFLIVIFLYLFFFSTEGSSKWNNLVGGILAGLIVGLLQMFLSWYEFKKIKRFDDLQVIDIKENRDDREFYKKLIKKSEQKIEIMGVTANRFINHFADIDGNNRESKVFLEALARNVQCKILLPNVSNLNDKQQVEASQISEEFRKIKEKYPENFEFKFFDHSPAHSIFVVDDLCILGPVFPELSSKDTPAIHLRTTSRYAIKYLDHFSKVWAEST